MFYAGLKGMPWWGLTGVKRLAIVMSIVLSMAGEWRCFWFMDGGMMTMTGFFSFPITRIHP